MKKLLWLVVCVFSLSAYDFKGKHYIASYLQCDPTTVKDNLFIYSNFIKAIKKSGATILSYNLEIFETFGMTAMCILSESHASIHTYPEHNSVFVDLFTCGEQCDWHEFERVMKLYLNPQVIERKVMVRE